MHKVHGLYHTRLHNIWAGMKARCNYSKHIDREWYQTENIRVCDEWNNSFKTFYDWAINNGYVDGLTIDRIDNALGYSPENCRFATPKEQANNRRTNLNFIYNGETKTLKQWAEYFGIKYSSLYYKVITKGVPFDQAINQY